MQQNILKVIIIDDEEPARNLIRTFLSNDNDFEIICEAADGFSAVKEINSLKPDLVFLDIQMPKLTGLEVLELLENPPAIIFVTAYDNFAVQAFEQNAIDYILKPYTKERFLNALTKVKEKISINSNKSENYKKIIDLHQQKNEQISRIAIKNNSKVQLINVENITYFEAQDDYVMIYSENGKFIKYLKMNYLEQNLDSDIFVRIHRSTIVNINFIDKIELWQKDSRIVILKNKTELKTSANGYKLLKEKLNI